MNIINITSNITFKAFKTTSPKFGSKCCWMNTNVFLNNTEIQIFWECMRGKNYFFLYNNQWYKIPFEIGKFPKIEDNLSKVEYHDCWKTE